MRGLRQGDWPGLRPGPFLLALLGLAAAALAACDSPAPQMWGGQELRVTRGGRNYAIHLRGNLVEVIRFGWASRAEQPAIRQQMVALIPEATGCLASPASLAGDSGEIRARLLCPRGVTPLLRDPARQGAAGGPPAGPKRLAAQADSG